MKDEVRKMVANDDGLVITDRYNSACAGYLFLFNGLNGNGKAYDPAGLVEGVETQEQVDAHNKVLSRMEIEGLDKCCKVGQGGTFYVSDDGRQIRTWIGEVVGTADSVKPWHGGKKILFRRKGKTLEGVVKKADCFGFFKCIHDENQARPKAEAGRECVEISG